MFDFIGDIIDGVSDIFGGEGGKDGVWGAIGTIGKAAASAFMDTEEPTPSMQYRNPYQPRELATESMSDARPVQFDRSEDFERIHNEWMDRMARFAFWSKTLNRDS